LSIVSWLQSQTNESAPVHISVYQPLLNKIKRVSKRGAGGLILWIKDTRTALLLALSGEYPIKRVKGVRVTHDGIPKVLGTELIEIIRNLIIMGPNPHGLAAIRSTLTILFSTRALNAGRTPDTSTVTDPGKGIGIQPIYLKEFWQHLGYQKRHSIPKSVWWSKYHFTTKSGPNGHALWTSFQDLINIEYLPILDSIKILGGPKLHSNVNKLLRLKSYLTPILPSAGTVLRRISYFPDRELKVRIIAIGDYWSQTALRPLHQFLFRIMKKIPQDCTFQQGSFVQKIEGWQEFYSIDLTAATDRFPISLESSVLRGYFPDHYVDAWEHIMVGIPFEYTGPDKIKKNLSYQVGNPMGFYSSWNSFALAHHYVMFHCCKELSIPWKQAKYVLLGDDILIGDHSLAVRYKEVITSLGVNFSPLKTHESKTLCEFAKRYVWKGHEISPFPISALNESAKRYYLMVNLLLELREKGFVAHNGIPAAISEFHKVVMKLNSQMRTRLQDRSLVCELMMKVMRGTETASNCLNTVARTLGFPLIELEDEQSLGIIQSLVVEAFTDSNPVNQKSKGYPLGKLAEDILIQITAIEDFEVLELLCDCTHRIPLLACYGQIEESYMDLTKEAHRIDTVGGGEWPLLFRSMALPLDDRIFVERQSHLISRASSIISDKLTDRMKLFCEVDYLRNHMVDPTKPSFYRARYH
jgi:hypothetical protein